MKKFKNSRLSTDSRKLQTLALKARDSRFESKIGARFKGKSMRARWDAKYYPRDYGIALDFGSGLLH